MEIKYSTPDNIMHLEYYQYLCSSYRNHRKIKNKGNLRCIVIQYVLATFSQFVSHPLKVIAQRPMDRHRFRDNNRECHPYIRTPISVRITSHPTHLFL